MIQKCNLDTLERKIQAVRKTSRPLKRFKPLFEHLFVLARSSAQHGYCQRAGQEIAKAKKVAAYR